MSRFALFVSLFLAPACFAQNLCHEQTSTGASVWQPCPTWSNENLAYVPLETISTVKFTTRISLSGNMALSIAAGKDGQFKCINFVHDATTTQYTVKPPGNMIGLFSPTTKRNQQCFIYYVVDGLWEALGPGVIGQ